MVLHFNANVHNDHVHREENYVRIGKKKEIEREIMYIIYIYNIIINK